MSNTYVGETDRADGSCTAKDLADEADYGDMHPNDLRDVIGHLRWLQQMAAGAADALEAQLLPGHSR